MDHIKLHNILPDMVLIYFNVLLLTNNIRKSISSINLTLHNPIMLLQQNHSLELFPLQHYWNFWEPVFAIDNIDFFDATSNEFSKWVHQIIIEHMAFERVHIILQYYLFVGDEKRWRKIWAFLYIYIYVFISSFFILHCFQILLTESSRFMKARSAIKRQCK